MRILRLISIIVVLLIFATCKKAFNPPAYTRGSADFTNYIAVGNSLTQGYMNGGVYEEGQRNSYPSILAQQMKLVQPNMPPFVQPIFSGNGSGYIHLEWRNATIQVVQPQDNGGYKPDANFQDSSYYRKKYGGMQLNNLGVSGIKMVGAVADPNLPQDNYMCWLLAQLNPYFLRMFNMGGPPPGNIIYYLNNVGKSRPTFFTCWMGDNDILGYATNGGQVDSGQISGATFYAYGLSDPTEFRKKYDMALDSLTKNGAKGVAMTIPNVTSIPFFNLVKLQNLKNSDGSQMTVWIKTNHGTRVATIDDVLLLPVASKLGKFQRDAHPYTDSSGFYTQVYCHSPYGLDSLNPIKNVEVLDRDEFPLVAPALAALNAQIKASAMAHHVPICDMEEFLTHFESGFMLNGANYSTQYIQGGVFGLDGVHPNARGYAIVANKVIAVINANYNSNIPLVNINNYKGITFP